MPLSTNNNSNLSVVDYGPKGVPLPPVAAVPNPISGRTGGPGLSRPLEPVPSAPAPAHGTLTTPKYYMDTFCNVVHDTHNGHCNSIMGTFKTILFSFATVRLQGLTHFAFAQARTEFQACLCLICVDNKSFIQVLHWPSFPAKAPG